MRKHPSDMELVRASLADPHAEAAPATRAHLDAGCDRCRRRVQELSSVIAALAAPALAEVPRELTEKAVAWLAAQTEAGRARARSKSQSRDAKIERAARQVMQALEEVHAVLVLDTTPGTVLEGIRGAATARGRRLLYETPVGDLHLQIEPLSVGRFAIQGQFLPSVPDPDPASGRAVLARQDGAGVCQLSGTGEFHFADEAMSEVRLHVEWGGRRIVVDPIDMSNP